MRTRPSFFFPYTFFLFLFDSGSLAQRGYANAPLFFYFYFSSNFFFLLTLGSLAQRGYVKAWAQVQVTQREWEEVYFCLVVL